MSCETGFSLAAVTGEGMAGAANTVSSLWSSLVQAGLAVQFVNYGASPITWSIGLLESESDKAVEPLYLVVVNA